MPDFCDECSYEMDICRKCLEQPACSDCDHGICTSCYLRMDVDDDEDDRDGIAEGYENAGSPLTLADRKAFLKLPIEERRRILAKQADAIADLYESNREGYID